MAIVGAGIMGAATACWLGWLDPRLRVLLIERDPSYQRASSVRSASSIRQQFSQPVNVALSRFGIEFLRDAGRLLAVDGHAPEIGLVEPGYLTLARRADAAGQQALRAGQAMQQSRGAAVSLLDPAALSARFPWLRTDDLGLGAFGESGEGWFDGEALLRAFLRKARTQGVAQLHGEVVAIEHDDERVRAVCLADGRRVACGALVDAAGAWAGEVARLTGVQLAVRARRRSVFVLSSPAWLAACPLVVDPAGFWFRPEGRGYIAGLEPTVGGHADPIEDGPLEPELERFEELWPRLAHRVPAFEALRMERAWAGYYDMHLLDHNAVIGPHPQLRNLYFVCGFSGHGMQHAPGAGRAVAEQIVHGEFRTLDLGALGFGRVLAGSALREANVIG